MKYTFFLLALLLIKPSFTHAQLTLNGFLKIPEGKTVLFGNDTSSVGNKVIWYGSKGAFRAGSVDYISLSSGQQWNYNQVGAYSFASGKNTMAGGYSSTAMGYRSIASGLYSTAMGYYTIASGNYSIAVGSNTTASGTNSTALGTYADTNQQTGSFIIGDASTFDPVSNDKNNQFSARFTGGYKFFTTTSTSSNSALGVEIAPGGNAWVTISDSAHKENFQLADGESFLVKIGRMRLGSWNYKGQEPNRFRHYGPMAQDFFAAFGHDKLGTVGNDKTINQADFDGINFIAIQALIQKINKLEVENQALRVSNLQQQKMLQKEVTSLYSELEQIKKQLAFLNSNTIVSKE